MPDEARARTSRSTSRAPSTTFQTIRPTRTTAPSAAAPATPCRRGRRRRTRRPVKGRRAASGVASSELTIARDLSYAVDLLDPLLANDQRPTSGAARRGASARSVWPFVTAQTRSFLRSAAFAPDCFCTIDVRVGRDRVRVRVLLSGGLTIESAFVLRRLLIDRGGGDDARGPASTNLPDAVLHLEDLEVVAIA